MSIETFKILPQNAFAYWINDSYKNIYSKGKSLSSFGLAKKGLSTGDNDYFFRYWFEVNFQKEKFDSSDSFQAMFSGKKWFPINKGGAYRKWYGNNDFVVNYENNGKELLSFKYSIIRNSKYYFLDSLTWTDLTSGNISFRYNKKGFIHDVAGPCIFNLDSNLPIIFGILNSKVINSLLTFSSPTLHYNIGSISELPIILPLDKDFQIVKDFVEICVAICKKDWDSFETSWNFEKHPLI